MAVESQLDAAGGPRKVRVIFLLLAILLRASPAFAQEHPSDHARQASAEEAVNTGRWEEALNLARGPTDQPPELEFWATGMIRPSDGCTSTQPWPENDIWTDSPDPRPIRFFILKSVRMFVVTPLDQVIAQVFPPDGYFPLTWWAGLAVLCAWAAIALGAAAYVLRKRDV